MAMMWGGDAGEEWVLWHDESLTTTTSAAVVVVVLQTNGTRHTCSVVAWRASERVEEIRGDDGDGSWHATRVDVSHNGLLFGKVGANGEVPGGGRRLRSRKVLLNCSQLDWFSPIVDDLMVMMIIMCASHYAIVMHNGRFVIVTIAATCSGFFGL